MASGAGAGGMDRTAALGGWLVKPLLDTGKCCGGEGNRRGWQTGGTVRVGGRRRREEAGAGPPPPTPPQLVFGIPF